MRQGLKAISILPKAGLGNKLFAWASGVVFSSKNSCPHLIVGLTKIHPMAIIRGERSKRFYFGYFKNERLVYYFPKYKVKKLKQKDAEEVVTWSGLASFSEIPHWSDRFHVIRDYRQIIIKRFWDSLTDRIKGRIDKHSSPCISLHIRMGDFRELKEGEDFSKVGAVRTPLNYFQSTLEMIRKFSNSVAPVTVFSDGTDKDLKPLLDLPYVRRAEEDLDIVHLAVMSKSKVIIMSAGSTFSFWAGFLSEAILIDHYQHKHSSIRDSETNQKVFEGVIDPEAELPRQLLRNLNEISN